MKKILQIIKITFQLLKCLSCSHKDNCPYSLTIVYKGEDYTLTVERKDGVK